VQFVAANKKQEHFSHGKRLEKLVVLVTAVTRPILFVVGATDATGHTSEFSPAFDEIFQDDFE
jgi:hypothetical protein